MSDSEIFEEIINQGVSFEPGENVEYSNSGYYLLAKIVEQKYKKNYASIARNEIARSLNLKNFKSVTKKEKNIFSSYHYNEKWYEIQDFDFSNVIGVGDIVSTTKDLNIFLYNLLEAKILKKESVENMKPLKDQEFGKGLMLVPFYKRIFFGHGGDTYGTHSLVSFNTEDNIGLAIAINGERFPQNDFAVGILSLLYQLDYEFPIFYSIKHTSEELDKFLGIYSNSNYPLKLTITRDGNMLKGQGTGQPSFPLEAVAFNKFRFEKASLELEFILDENKMIHYQNCEKVEMIKE